MPINKYLFIIITAGLLAFGGLIWLILKTSPQPLGWPGIVLFFSLFLIACFSFLTTLGFYARLFYTNNELYFNNFYTSLRQGGEGSFFITLILLFQYLHILNLFIVLLLTASFCFFELYFQGKNG